MGVSGVVMYCRVTVYRVFRGMRGRAVVMTLVGCVIYGKIYEYSIFKHLYIVLRVSLLRLASSNSIQNKQMVTHVRVCVMCIMCVCVRRRGGGERAGPRAFL
jgi:hypothetical protein